MSGDVIEAKSVRPRLKEHRGEAVNDTSTAPTATGQASRRKPAEGESSRRAKVFATVLTLVLFGAALSVLQRSLAETSLRAILRTAAHVPATRLALVGVCTLASYAVLTCCDALVLRILACRLPYKTVALTSFTAFGIANTLGVSSLSGGSVRLKSYTAQGLSPVQVASVQLLCSWTFFLGAALVSGLGMLFGVTHVTRLLHVPALNERAVGTAILVALGGYAWATLRVRRPLRISAWSLRLPSLRQTLGQVAISVADLAFAAGSLYILLPSAASTPSFLRFLPAYVIAITVGAASNVPGGLGVFESGLLLLLPGVPVRQLLGAVLIYRALYSLVPFVVALGLLFGRELLPLRSQLGGHGRRLMRGVEAMVPQLLAAAVFGAGALLTLSGSLPAIGARVDVLRAHVPLPVLEVSHLLGSVSGVALMVLARGIYRRLDAAYFVTQVLLQCAIVASLLKGIDIEASLLLLGVVALLFHARRRFTRRASLLVVSWWWLLQIGLVLGCVVFVGFFAYRHVEYSHELWWQFAFDAGASHMLRASVVSTLVLASISLWSLMRPHRPPAQRVTPRELERASACLARSTDSLDQLALLGDKQLLFADRDEGFLMFRGSGKCLIALGDPVGPAPVRSELAWRYRELCDDCGMLCVFYKVHEEMLPLYLDLGLSLAKLGEEAHVSLPDFELTGHDRAGLRTAARKVTQGQLSFALLDPARVQARMPELEAVSRSWLANKHAAEKGFSIGSFEPSYIARMPCAVVEQAGQIVAFANVLGTSGHEEIAIDLMRFTQDAPSGVMDGLLVHLMLWGKEQGYERFNLGMAPLSGLQERPLSPLWHKAGLAVHAYGQSYYNFDGLRRYKEKFRPVWRPRYLASPGGIALPRVLFDTTTLIAGGIKTIVTK